MKTGRAGEKILWGSGPATILLRPLGSAYGAAAKVREAMYRRGILASKKVSRPVISVGNITLGGSGKTPLVMHLAAKCAAEGIKPAVLTRGYGGSASPNAAVVNATDDPDSVGDEALLMARSLPGIPVIRCPSRLEAAELAQKLFNPDIYILDDAFGHLKIQRDVDIVVVDASRGFGNSRVFPAGPLREPLSAMARADVIIVRSDDKAPGIPGALENSIKKHAPNAQIMKMCAVPLGPASWKEDGTVAIQHIDNKRLLAFSGIGNPDSFDRTLKAAGLAAVAHLRYRDHHKYSDKDMSNIQREAEKVRAEALITTEKDLVRLSRDNIGGMPLFALRIGLEVERFEWLMQLIKSKPTKNPST